MFFFNSNGGVVVVCVLFEYENGRIFMVEEVVVCDKSSVVMNKSVLLGVECSDR